MNKIFENLVRPFRKPKPLTFDDQFHKYREDITEYKKQLNTAMQYASVTQGKPEHPFAMEECHRLRILIEVAEKTIVRLSEKEQRKHDQAR